MSGADQRQSQSLCVSVCFLRRWIPVIGGDALCLLLVLKALNARQASLEELAALTGYSVSKIKRLMQTLRTHGLLRWKVSYQYDPLLKKSVRAGIIPEVCDEVCDAGDSREDQSPSQHSQWIPWDENTPPPGGAVLVRTQSGVYAVPFDHISDVICRTGGTLHAMYDLDVPGNSEQVIEALEQKIRSMSLSPSADEHELVQLLGPDRAREILRSASDKEKRRICAWVRYTKSQRNLRNPAGFLMAMIRSGQWPPEGR